MTDAAIPRAILLVTLMVAAMTPEVTPSADAPSCVDISAAVYATNYEYYFFSGNHYAYYNSIQAMSGRGGAGASTQSINDVTGMDPDVEITAGYMEPDSDHVVRLFAGSGDFYRVDLTEKNVLEKDETSSMFTEPEMASLESGVQAAAILGQYRYFFSGCNVLKTDLDGDVGHFDLREVNLPCDVDAALAYPRQDFGHLLLTKGGKSYGWIPGSRGYYMFCAASVFPNVAFDLCGCEHMGF